VAALKRRRLWRLAAEIMAGKAESCSKKWLSACNSWHRLLALAYSGIWLYASAFFNNQTSLMAAW